MRFGKADQDLEGGSGAVTKFAAAAAGLNKNELIDC